MIFKNSNNNNHHNGSGDVDSGFHKNQADNSDEALELRPTIEVMHGLSEDAANYLAQDFDMVDKDIPKTKEIKRVKKPAPKIVPGLDMGLNLTNLLARDAVKDAPVQEQKDIPSAHSLLAQKQQEIKELREDRDMLLRKQQFYYAFFQKFNKALLFITPDTLQVKEANEAAGRRLGRWVHQLRDVSLKKLVSQEARADLDNFIINLLSGHPSRIELELEIPQSGKTKIRMAGIVLKYNNRTIGILLDVL